MKIGSLRGSIKLKNTRRIDWEERKKKEKKTQITTISNERKVISVSPSDIIQIVKEYYEQLRSITLSA